jgi:hypothetical protein
MANFFKKILLSVLLLFFCLGPQSVLALTLTETENVSVSARVGEEVVVTPGGGSSAGGFIFPKTAVRFTGEAYPLALVSLLKQGQVAKVIQADSKGIFDITLEEKYDSNILYSLFAEDVSGNRSILINYPIAVQTGFVTALSGIRFAPTIVTDKIEVKRGGYLTVSGYALPQKDLLVSVEGGDKKTFTLTSNANGSYKIVLPLGNLSKGDYAVHVQYNGDDRISKLISFTIGDTDVFTTTTTANIPGDCNADKIINLVDFSVLAYWYGKNNPPLCVDTNHDNKINLVDFSILAFWWTG